MLSSQCHSLCPARSGIPILSRGSAGSAILVTATVDPSGNWIKIAADDTTATAGAGGTGATPQAVAAQHEDVVVLGQALVVLDLDGRIEADRADDHVRRRGAERADQIGTILVEVAQRVVARDLRQHPVAQEVRARVTAVADVDEVLFEPQADGGRAHAVTRRVLSERWYTAAFAAFIAAISGSGPGAGGGSPVFNECTIVRIAMSDATWPDA